MGVAAAMKIYAKLDPAFVFFSRPRSTPRAKKGNGSAFTCEDAEFKLKLRFVGKRGAAAMGVWYRTEPTMDNFISNASTEQDCAAEDSLDQDLQLSADSENWSKTQRQLSATARDRILELYDELRPKLFPYLRSLRLERDQVDEVIQETFMRLTTQLLKESEIENVRGWIVRVAHNLAMTLQKKERRSMASSDALAFAMENRPDPALSPEEAYSSREQFKRMTAALAVLNPQHRQCFQMRAQGFRYKDIGLALGISEQRAAFLVKQIAVQLAAICG